MLRVRVAIVGAHIDRLHRDSGAQHSDPAVCYYQTADEDIQTNPASALEERQPNAK